METSSTLAPIVASLRKSLSTMEAAISALPDPVAVLDDSSNFAWVNEAFERLLGHSRLMLLGSSFTKAVSEKIVDPGSARELLDRFRMSSEGILTAALSVGGESVDEATLTKTFRLEWSPGAGGESCVVIFKDIDADLEVVRLEERSKSLEQKALCCALTGLLNRSGFVGAYERIDSLDREYYSILFIDLDGFKFVNDSYGHDLGDEVLREVGFRIKSKIRGSDFAARLSGDEFVLAIRLGAARPIDHVKKIARKLVRILSRPIEVDLGSGVHIHVSVGVSIGFTIVEKDDQLTDVLARADSAMYAAKKSTTGHVAIRLKHRSEMLERSRILTSQILASIVESKDIPLHLQPIFDLNEDVVVGYEALMRPVDSSGVSVPIPSLLEVAADSAQLAELERVVFSSAARLIRFGYFSKSSLTLAVNVSVLSLSRSDFVDKVIDDFHRIGFPFDRLIVEVTESDLIQNIDQVRESLIRLRGAGSKVYLDDFCTGHTGFAQLIELPVDGFKVDQKFVNELFKSKEALAVMKCLALLGRSLDLDVVVEGVESQRQLDLVRSLGMVLCQGFLLGIPQDPRCFDEGGAAFEPVQACSLDVYQNGSHPFTSQQLREEIF